MLGLFVNRLTTNEKYSLRDTETFQQKIQTALYEKQKAFSGFFIAFRKCGDNLEHFEKKDASAILIISEIIDSKRGCYLNV